MPSSLPQSENGSTSRPWSPPPTLERHDLKSRLLRLLKRWLARITGAMPSPRCPRCGSERTRFDRREDFAPGRSVVTWRCRSCSKRFSAMVRDGGRHRNRKGARHVSRR